jgi:hypothetical protein
MTGIHVQGKLVDLLELSVKLFQICDQDWSLSYILLRRNTK